MTPFTDEHELLRRTIRAFVEKEVVPQVAAWEDAGEIPRSFWRRLGELGLLGLEFPVEHGGGGGDFFSSVVLGEEMARCRSGGVAFSVLVHTDMSSPWLTRYGTEAQKRKYLPGIIRGETVCALGITEPGTGSDMAAVSTRAARKDDHYLLTGRKIFITNGVYGDLYFVAARTGDGSPDRRHDGLSMFLVERGWPGFEISKKLDKMGMRASDTAELSFQDVRVPAANLLGREGVGFYEVMRVFQRERLVAGLHAIAGCQRALDDTVAYVQERQAFGSPLSEKQVIRHKLADLATLVEAGRALTYAACLKFAEGVDAVKEISMVKLFTAEMAQKVAYDCVQLHGGYGYMREYAIERFFRDTRLMTIGGGTSEVMKEIIAKQLEL